MDIPADSVPAELKPVCEQILKRARELRKADPVMCYWCCFSAANSSMTMKRSPEGTTFLIKLLDVLEEMKSTLLSPDSGVEAATITDEAAGSAYVENFAMNVFLQADNEDRQGKANKGTVRKFIVAAQFIEVLRTFDPPNGMRDETEQKLRYARWKAADIAKALKEGRKPTPGPPGGEEDGEGDEDLPSFPDVGGSSLAGSFTGTGTATEESTSNLHRGSEDDGDNVHIPDYDAHKPRPVHLSRNGSTESGSWSTAATPGVRATDKGTATGRSGEEDDEYGFPAPADTAETPAKHASSSPVGIQPNTTEQDEVEKKGVRFAGPDGASLSPAGTYTSVDSYISPENPPPSELGGSTNEPAFPSAPTKYHSHEEPSFPILPSTPPTAPSAPAPVLPSTSTSASSSTPTAPPTLPPPPSAPPTSRFAPAPPSPRISHAQVHASIPAPAPPLPQHLDTKTIEKTQKHAKWAISAMDYNDLDTARLELRKALDILEGRATV